MYVLMVNRVKPGVEPEELGKVIPPHVEWLKERIAEGRVVQAGKWGDFGGMAVLKAVNIDEAKKTLKEDPLIKSGLVTYEAGEFFPAVEIR